MTAPVVGQVSVEVLADAAALAKSLKKEIEGSFKKLDFSRLLSDSLGDAKVKIPVVPESGAEFSLRLRGAVDRASVGVKAKIKLEPEQSGSFVSALKNLAGGISGSLGSAFGGGGNGRGFGSFLSNILPSVSGLASAFGDLSSEIQKSAGSSAQLGGSLAGAAESAAGPIGVAVGLMVAVGTATLAATAAAYALGPALGLVSAGLATAAGAAAAIPAALAGVGAVVGTLGLGLDGISAAFKPKAGGGGGGGGGESAAQHARQVAAAERSLTQAERGLADAQQRSRLAQVAVNQARLDAAEDIDDLSRALRGAKLDEADATQAVQDSLLALNTAKLSGNIPDINRANLAYQRAQLTLENAKDSAEDLGLKQADAAKKGVAGSDKVQQALRDQASAQEAVRSAQDGVLSAQDGLAAATEKQGAAGAKAAATQVKLAASAQKFVAAVKALKPAFESLRLDVQQRLFAGLDKTVTHLGKSWIPALKVTLGKYGDTFNAFFRGLGAQLSQPKFISDVQAGAEGARKGLTKIGDAVNTSLVPAFGTLARAAGPFLAQFGAEIAKVVTKFGEWIEDANKTGSLKTFFDEATTAMHDLFDTGTQVSSIIGSIVGIIAGSDTKGKSGETALEKFNGQLKVLAGYLKDPKNQEKIRDFIGGIKDFAAQASDAAGKANSLLTSFRNIRTLLFGDGPAQAKKDDQTAINMGGTPLASDDTKTKSYSFGEDIGAALVAGIIGGIGGANGLLGSAVAHFLWEGSGSVLGKIKTALGIHSPSTVMAGIGRNMIQGLIIGIGDTLGGLGAKVAQIPGIVGRAVRGAGSWLYDTGLNLVRGLWKGISDSAGWLKGKILNWAKDAIPRPLWQFFGIHSPSKLMAEMGGHLATGLAKGMDDGAGAVEAAAKRMADRAIPTMSLAASPAMSFAMNDAALTASVSAAATHSYELAWKTGTTGDKILDAIREKIKLSYRGDANRAFSTA